jgi:hypothetical protein
MAYSNAHILSAVLSHWARPAVTQLATERLVQMPMLQAIQQKVISTGLVNAAYNIGNDLTPLLQPIVNNILQPYLERQLSQLPDEAIPSLAREILSQASSRGEYQLLDGAIILDKEDIAELSNLVEKNLPLTEKETYEVKI